MEDTSNGDHGEIIEQIKAVLERFNQDFDPPNLEEIIKCYHRDVVHYVTATGRFYRGRDDIRENFFAPFVANVSRGKLDFSPYTFKVVNPDLVIAYGAIPGLVEFKDGNSMVQNPLPQTVVWIRNDEPDPVRPFVVIAAHE